MKGIEDQLKLLFTSGIAAALSTPQNSASVALAFNSLIAATNQPAIIQSSPTQSITPSVTPAVTPVTPTVTPVTPAVTPVTPAVTPVTPAVTPVTPAVTPVTPVVTPVTPAVTPVTPAVMPAITPEITPAVTSQMPVLSSPAPANASTSGNVVSKSTNNPITSMSDIFADYIVIFYKKYKYNCRMP